MSLEAWAEGDDGAILPFERDHADKSARFKGVIMADVVSPGNDTYVTETVSDLRRTSWGAIWAGTFAFIAIWAVFGMLGEAIFASAANPSAAEPVGGMSIGMGFWGVILTIIAMYVGGRVTGHFSNAVDRGSRLLHGLAMFGLSVISFVIVAILSGAALSGGSGLAGGAHSSYILTVFADLGWIGFFSLFFGWLAAMGGAAHGILPSRTGTAPVTGTTTTTRDVQQIRRAA